MALAISLRFAAVLLALGSLSGCAESADPAARPTLSSPDPKPTVSDTPADPLAAFRGVADASCTRATETGVVERTEDGSASNILVPKSEAYQDFTAVAVSADDGWSLIWSTEDFAVCNASVGFAMAEDSGGTYDLTVTVDESDGSFRTSYHGGEGVVIENRYLVEDGVIVTAFLGPAGNALQLNVTYGMPTTEQIAMLHSAVDAFLAED